MLLTTNTAVAVLFIIFSGELEIIFRKKVPKSFLFGSTGDRSKSVDLVAKSLIYLCSEALSFLQVQVLFIVVPDGWLN